MKTITGGMTTSRNKKDLEELVKDPLEMASLKNSPSSYKFGAMDLWRMQKKHKTLGSSTRW